MRKPRVLQDNATYHVIARANHRELLLDPPAVKVMFLEVVKRAKTRFDFQIDNFVLMGNHFHFIIKPGANANLSEIMKWILQVFASRYNRVYQTTGHFWASRFFSWIIPNFWEYIRVFSYIDNNPVRAQLVDQAWDWDFGGLSHRRRGWSEIVGELPRWLRGLFSGHERLRLPDRTGPLGV